MLAALIVSAICAGGADAASHRHGCAAPSSRVRAYGYVKARGLLSGEPAVSCASGVLIRQLYHATVGAPRSGSPVGSYCLALTHVRLSSVEPVLLVSAVEPPPSVPAELPYATWVRGAGDCASGQLEVRTYTYAIVAGTLTAEPSQVVSFSFVVL
jgi:hypothetical protein